MEYLICNKVSMRKNGMRLTFSCSKIFQENGNKKNRQKRVNFYFRYEFSGKKESNNGWLTKQPGPSWTTDLQRFSVHRRRLIYIPEIFASSKTFMTLTFNFLNFHPISYLSASVTHNKRFISVHHSKLQYVK